MKKIILFTVIIVLSSLASFAQSTDSKAASLDFLTSDLRNRLYSEGEITRYFFTSEEPQFLFDNPFKYSILKDLEQLDVSVGVESLYLLRYEDISDSGSPSMLDIYNTLSSLQTMKGIEYYSHSRKKMRTLFTESHEVVSPDDKTPVDDPVFTEIPYSLNRIILQNDKTFGENIYTAEYRFSLNTVWVSLTNKTTLSYMLIPMLKPDKMSVNLFVAPTEDGLLFYGILAAETVSLFGLEKSKKESFYNRIKAMYNWFGMELKGSLQP